MSTATVGTDNTTSADTARTIAADKRRARRAMPAWPLAIIAAPAAVAVWSGWVGLGGLCGFGLVQPLPGIVRWHLDTAITLPVGIEAYAAFALGAWLRSPAGPVRTFARRSAIGALALGMTGQVIYHLLAAAHAARAPWPVVMFVSCLPVVSLAFGTALAHLMRDNDTRPGPDGPARWHAGGPVVEVPAGTAVRVAPGPDGGTRADLAAVKAARLTLESELLARQGRAERPPGAGAERPAAGERPTAPGGAVSASAGRSAPPAGLSASRPAVGYPLPGQPRRATGSGEVARPDGPARSEGPGRATVPPPSGPAGQPGPATVPPARPAPADSGPVPSPTSPMPQGIAAAQAAFRVSVTAGDAKSARQLAADHGISRRQAAKITNEDRADVPRPLALVRNTAAETTGARR